MRRTLFLLFFVHLLTRLIYVNISGIYNNYNLQCDSYWLVQFADQAMNGNFNFDIKRFIASPLFPIICGIFKALSENYWPFYLILFQLILSSLSGLYIYKITYLIFRNKETALQSSLIYAVFPMTLWYVHTFSQESIFESLLIATVYYLLASLKSGKTSDTIKAAVLFSLTYLTKSHILLFSLFIPLIYIHFFRLKKITLKLVAVFILTALAFSLPYGLYHLGKNGIYVLSSNGAGYQFYLGNTEAGYRTIVDVPLSNSDDYNKMKDITVHAGFFNGSVEKYDSILNGTQKTKQHAFYSEAWAWIKNHPYKFITLKLYDTFFFFLPGISFRHYTFLNWIASFLIGLPIYFFAYKAICINCKDNFKLHSWIFYLIFSMLIFSTFWYVQNRFRTITLEPFYIIYASLYFDRFLLRAAIGISIVRFLNVIFLEFLQNICIKDELKKLLH